MGSEEGEGETRMQLQGSLRRARPELVRCVPCSELLTGFARHFSQGWSIDEWNWHDSKTCEVIDVFVSHSWRAPRWKKFIGLSLSFNGNAALLIAVTGFVLVVLLQFYGILPPMSYIATIKKHIRYPCSAWCGVFAGISYFGVMTFWQTIARIVGCTRCLSYGTFLDRLCICQDDDSLKMEGIHMLGHFLEKSSCMLVLLDPTYFTRLWCVLEIAAFSHAGEQDGKSRSITFLSLDLATVASAAAGASWVKVVISYVYQFTNPSWSLEVLLCVNGFGMLLFSPFWLPASIDYVRARMRLQGTLQRFSVDNAECSLDADRTLICGSIGKWFGDVTKFEEFVRTDCCDLIIKQAGIWDLIPLWYIVLIGLPEMCRQADILVHKDPSKYSAQYRDHFWSERILFTFDVAFVLPALWLRCFFLVVKIVVWNYRAVGFCIKTGLVIFGVLLHCGILRSILFFKRQCSFTGFVTVSAILAALSRTSLPALYQIREHLFTRQHHFSRSRRSTVAPSIELRCF